MAENTGARGAKEAVVTSGKRVALGNLTNVFRGSWGSGAANSASDAVRLLIARSHDRSVRFI
jgi:hypothetical protein